MIRVVGYSFRFQKLMDLKEREKEDSKTKYSESLGFLNREMQELEGLTQSLQQWEEKRVELERQATPIQRLLEIHSYIQHLENLIVKKHEKVHEAEKKTESLHLELSEKMRDFQVWEKWKEKTYKEYQDEMMQREQKEMDELAIQRFVRRGGT